MDLFTKSWFEQHGDCLEDWQRSTYKDFVNMMGDEENPYPCIPGMQGFISDTLRFGYAGSPTDEGSHKQLAKLLKQYGKVSRDTGKYASLVVFFDSREMVKEEATIDEYQNQFWTILNQVHKLDEQEWPEHIPKEPHHHEWEFCFDGEPYFAFCATPAHVIRKSRQFPTFLIAFQPRWVFDEINASTTFGQKLKRAIRKRLVAYDGVDPHPALKWYGQQDNYEWEQYFLHDNDSSLSKCPFTAMMNKFKKLQP
ncbi:YqcI/YcgG family protein [Guptibacillus hwajinpoensis]|uniref:YqcI/YcgG family protein n=1 Tax=Guptibacillus hwajinpoensis TaxID=208199 RepID=UPI003735E707